MGNTAFLFPGQGSQKVGMGADLLEARPDVYGRYLSLADDVCGLPVRSLSLDGPIEDLTRTDVAQPALFSLSLAVHEVAREQGLQPDFVAGHSLGEYTAAVASGALALEDGMRLVALRGRLMADIQNERPGGMAAILGLSAERVGELCEQAAEAGTVAPANLNTDTQIVCSGEDAAVDRLIELAEAAGADRALRLQVGAAFHSELMQPVQQRLSELSTTLPWKDPQTPLVANAYGTVLASGEDVHAALLKQIASPVLWAQCVRTMHGEGCDTFLELGSGRVLIGLVRQVQEGVETFAADSPKKLAKFAERG
ncbi:MAG TPA: ACP S-malonyltransferase [Solirubrobacteraceae bacterium]|jgi:[acyl-carrier-protein] S-malonyltransferase|nr:ACP S-malonyltransferase [Solirubrobacteraceae bacterium]